jgi:hypothetical protein
MGEINKQVKSTKSASDSLKGSFSQIIGQVPGLGKLSGEMNSLSGGVGGLTSKFKTLLASPIGLFLAAISLAIGTLTAAIKTDDETADAFGKTWDQISAIFDVVLRRIGLVGKGLLSLVTGDFKNGFDQLGGSVKGVGNELERAWTLTGDLADRQNKLDDDLNKFNATEQERINIIDKLNLQSKDRTKTEDERIKLETEAEQLLQKLTTDRMSLEERQASISVEAIGLKHDLQRQLNETTKEYGLRLLDNSAIGGEEAKTLSEAIKKVDLAQAESLKQLEKLQNQRNVLLDKQAQDEKKRADDRKKNAEKERANLLKQDEKDTEFLKKQQLRNDKIQDAQYENHLKRLENKAKASMTAALNELQSKNAAYTEDHENLRKIEEGKRAIQADSLAVFNEGTNSIIALLGATTEARKRNANTIKALEIGQVVVNGIVEVSNIAKTFSSLGPFGVVLAALQIGFAIARTVAGVQRIQSQQFYSGGYTGAGGKYQPAGTVHAGEVVWSQEDVAKFGGVRNVEAVRPTSPSALRGYYTGGPVNPFDKTRSSVSSTPATTPRTSDNSLERLEKAIMAQTEATNRRIDRIKVQNVVTETQAVMKVINTIREEANV